MQSSLPNKIGSHQTKDINKYPGFYTQHTMNIVWLGIKTVFGNAKLGIEIGVVKQNFYLETKDNLSSFFEHICDQILFITLRRCIPGEQEPKLIRIALPNSGVFFLNQTFEFS